jgi:uncharacterized repeat protein (TIGR01451 family)
MIKSNQKAFRAILTAIFGVFFLASAFIFNFNTAQMQTGANTVVFERYDSALGRTKVFVMNADGTNVTELADGFDPVWSPTGAKIAYAYGDSESYDIWTMNADGSQKTQLTENYRSYAPAWSPDGSRIAFVSDHEGGYHVYVVNSDGTNQHRINITTSEVTQEYAPTWSPDGSKVIFLAQKVVSGLSRNDYYATDSKGDGSTTQLTNLNALLEEENAAVSPDGSRLVFRYQFKLQAALLDGSNQMVSLTDNSTDREADYAPTGAKIIFRRGSLLATVNADGSNFVNLDVAGSNPDWNPSAVFQTPTPTPTATPTATPTPEIKADLSVQVTASSTSINVGQQVTYTVTVNNSGADTATNVVLSNGFSPILTLNSLQSSQGSCSLVGTGLSCQLGTLEADASASVTIVATANYGGFVSNQFGVNAIETDPDMSNNLASVNVTITSFCAQLFNLPYEVVRQQWRREERNGGQDELTITLRNVTNQNLDPRMIFVVDGLPSNVTVDSSVVAGYTQCAAPLGSPYIVAYAPNKKEWKPMQTISIRILFNNPSRGGIPYTYRLYSGNINP